MITTLQKDWATDTYKKHSQRAKTALAWSFQKPGNLLAKEIENFADTCMFVATT